MLTALDSEADAVLGLEAGADDYVTKPFGLAELRSRIRAVLRRAGTRAMGDEVLVVGPIVLDRAQREVTIDGAPVRLTFSEFELLDALMADPGRLLNRQELLRAIWGDSAYRDPRAIDVHIRHLREKLEPEPEKPRYILTVRGAGYRLRGPVAEGAGSRPRLWRSRSARTDRRRGRGDDRRDARGRGGGAVRPAGVEPAQHGQEHAATRHRQDQRDHGQFSSSTCSRCAEDVPTRRRRSPTDRATPRRSEQHRLLASRESVARDEPRCDERRRCSATSRPDGTGYRDRADADADVPDPDDAGDVAAAFSTHKPQYASASIDGTDYARAGDPAQASAATCVRARGAQADQRDQQRGRGGRALRSCTPRSPACC